MHFFIQSTFLEEGQGIVLIDGPKWREQRRYALQVLRNFGMGRNLMQERVTIFKRFICKWAFTRYWKNLHIWSTISGLIYEMV